LGKNDRVSDAVKSGVASSQEALGHLRSLLMKNPDASKESVRDVGSLEATLGSINSVANNAISVVGATKIKNSIHAALMGEEIPVDDEADASAEEDSYGSMPSTETAYESRRFRGRRMAEATEDWWPLTALSAKKLRDEMKVQLGVTVPFSAWKEDARWPMSSGRSGGILATASLPMRVPPEEYLLLAFSSFDLELSLYAFGGDDEGRYNVRAQLRWAHPTGGTNGATLGTFFIDQSGESEKVQFKAGY
jgi:hypothetical protein